MEVILLGAGKPIRGTNPAALKKIGLNTVALDWQLDAFKKIGNKIKVSFLGGYKLNKIKKKYPKINFIKNKKWKENNILDSFLKISFSSNSKIITYSDTIFRKKIYSQIDKIEGDVVFAVDTDWKKRFKFRDKEDILIAEKIKLKYFLSNNNAEAEFTGLILLRKKSLKFIENNRNKIKGKNLIDLLKILKKNNLKLNYIDVKKNWAEFNSEKDLAKFILGTKSETLNRLKTILKKSKIGDQYYFTVHDWVKNKNQILKNISDKFKGNFLIVRSSSAKEDSWNHSNAGAFTSVLDVDSSNIKNIDKSIQKVLNSYSSKSLHKDQIFVQKQIKDVLLSGVIFTCDLETGLSYYKINFDQNLLSTDSITSGSSETSRSIIIEKKSYKIAILKYPFLRKIILATKEIEECLNYEKLDIEFAVDKLKKVHIFQVRPITIDHSEFDNYTDINLKKKLSEASISYDKYREKRTNLEGNKIVYGNMPDWNPAEIIGVKPRPLAINLYKELITNSVWAKQRHEYGYKKIVKTPLMIEFCNQPYIDVRASLNSFIPENIPKYISKKLCNSYLDILINNPSLHDKIEFEVAFTIWTPNFIKEAKKRLGPYNFTKYEIKLIEESLKKITKNSFLRINNDTKNIIKLEQNRKEILNSDNNNILKFFNLLSDCKKYGTISFAHAARAGFVAIIMLKSFVKEKIITQKRYNLFMEGIHSVSKEFKEETNSDKRNKKDLIKRFGHLRPGTYEIKNKAYWENANFYLDTKQKKKEKTKNSKFKPTKTECKKISKMLDELNSSLSVNELLSFFYQAIEFREYTKFEFSKNLSIALDCLIIFGKENQLTRDELSFLKIKELKEYKKLLPIKNIKMIIQKRIEEINLTNLINLPSLITSKEDFFVYEQSQSTPNYITLTSITAELILINNEFSTKNRLKNNIVMIESADPGYDWLFSCPIAGLITKYGGANSHMAIRSAEKNLPAAIGVGIKIFNNLKKIKKIKMDCKNMTIEIIN